MPESQKEMSSGADETSLKRLDDFSFVSGGPLHQLWRSMHLSGDALQMVHRRMVAAALLAWVPLLLLSMVEGKAWGDSVTMAFLKDIETHARLLIAVPLLILAEVEVHRRIAPIVRRFLDRGLIPDAERPKFHAAIASAMRLGNSVVAELLLLLLVYTIGLYIWRTEVSLYVTSWFAVVEDGRRELSLAGWWAALVSIPLFQFLMVRWYFRLFIWARFLWQVSRMELNLEPDHPDGTAGLHFLSRAVRAYRLVVLSLGAVLSGMIANRIFYTGAKLLDFKPEIVGTVALLLLLILGPMLVFMPKLRRARSIGMDDYGSLGQRYARDFSHKWVRGGSPPEETPLGSPDIQSLADLHNGYLMLRQMHLAPVSMRNVTDLAVYALVPVAPLLLTTFSVEQLVERVLKVFF